MKRILSNIGVIISSLLVLLLSIGVSVSKMNCSMDNKIFLGTEVPNCMESKDKFAALQIKSTSCCKKTESISTCCPETNDNSCSSDTQSFQFDFETLTSVFSLKLLNLDLQYLLVIFYDSYSEEFIDNSIFYNHLSKGYLRPLLSNLQSFLL
jgi:hypothetical protein